MKIKEIIVVEGKDDTTAFNRLLMQIQLKQMVQLSMQKPLKKLNLPKVRGVSLF